MPTVKVVQDVPVLFADGVMSQAYAPGVSKFYLYRTDSAPDVTSHPAQNIPVLQVVMPARGFAALVHFFQHRLKLMIDEGAITKAEVDAINQTAYPNSSKQS